MRVSSRVLILCASISICGNSIFAESQKSAQLLALARDRMAAGSLDEAIHMLESALETASEDDCKPIVDQLRKSYQVAIYQSRQSGRHEQADHYSQNLKLIDSVAGTTTEPEKSVSASADSKSLAFAPIPEAAAGIAVPKAGGKPELTQPQSLPAPGDVPPLATELPQPVARGTEAGIKDGTAAVASAEKPSNSKVRQFDIAEADDAFRARKYADAGHTYQQLLDQGALPESRRGHLAYCRAAALVERINKGPVDTAEWNSIRSEIEAIQNIQPDFWFAEYLSDLVRERMNRTASVASNATGSSGLMERTANQIRSMNPLRKISR